MQSLAVVHGIGGLSPLEECAHVVVQVFGDGIGLPVQRKHHPEASVALGEVIRDGHHLVSGENLRKPAHRGHEAHHEFQFCGVFADHVPYAIGVVVAGEHHHIVRVGDVEVIGHGVVDFGDAVVPVFIVGVDAGADRIHQAEVHYRREVRVEPVPVGVVSLPVGDLRHVGRPHLAYDVVVRVFIHQGLAPLGHRFFLVVRVGVHPEPVKVGPFCPPDGPLLEILQEIRVVEVHVHHAGVKPAADHVLMVEFRAVRVVLGRERAVGMGVFRPLVHPVPEREILHPPVGVSAVVGHYVHDHPEASGMGLADEFAVFEVAAEARVYLVVVGAGVAVV